MTTLYVSQDAASGSAIVAATGVDTNIPLVLQPAGTGAIQASPTNQDYVTAATVNVGGSGYAVGDLLAVSGGTGTPAILKVATLSGSAVATVTVYAAGIYSVDPSTTGAATTAITGAGSSATFNLTLAFSGNARGANAVDLQMARGLATQVASGPQATIVGGQSCTANGQRSITGGDANSSAGYASVAFGSVAQSSGSYAIALGQNALADASNSTAIGFYSHTHGLFGAQVFASGRLAAQGDAQGGNYTLRGRATAGAAVRLTADNSTVGSANILNIPLNTAWAVTAMVSARDTSTGNCAVWHINFGLGVVASAATLVYKEGSTSFMEIIGSGVVAGTALSRAGDTTNRGINYTFTPPNSNTWDVCATFRTCEVQ